MNGVTGGGMSGLEGVVLDAPMSLSDLVFMETMSAVAEIDNALVEQMQTIKEIMKKKKEISEKIKRLKEALDNSKAKDPDDLVYVQGGLDNPTDPSADIFAGNREIQRDIQAMYKDGKITWPELWGKNPRKLLDAWKSLKTSHGKGDLPSLGISVTDEQLNSVDFYRKSAVETKIENLRSELEQLGGDQQLQLLNMQRLMNARSQRIQLSSSIENKDNQLKQSIIANIGK
ncbi:MAG: hypothetical protein D6806_15540 [Deltaproteobacteria bacterium]|nr:MAG: hypothetical protein D6806_15540 [Deltaproteobacteria bacterium]